MRRVILILSVAVVFCGRSDASVLGVADGHSLFVFGNFSLTNGSTQSRVSVGGNLSTSVFIGDDLVVGGSLTYTNSSAGGDITTGVLFTNPNNIFVAGTISQGTPINFAAAQADLTAKSAFWGTLATTGTISGNLLLTGVSAGLNVFNVTAAQWAAAGSRGISAPANSTVLINILGNPVAHGGTFLQGGITSSNIIYNYPQATSLQLTGFMPGIILAPFANLNFSSGSGTNVVIAASGTSSVFLGYGGDFAGSLPAPPTANAAPELASAVIWSMGIALCASWPRRRRTFDVVD